MTRPLEWMAAIRDHPDSPPTDQCHALGMVALRLNWSTGQGFCSIDQMADDAQISDSTAKRALRWARGAGDDKDRGFFLAQTRKGHRLGNGTLVASEWLLRLPGQPLTPARAPSPSTLRRQKAKAGQQVTGDTLTGAQQVTGDTLTAVVNRSMGGAQQVSGDPPSRPVPPRPFYEDESLRASSSPQPGNDQGGTADEQVKAKIQRSTAEKFYPDVASQAPPGELVAVDIDNETGEVTLDPQHVNGHPLNGKVMAPNLPAGCGDTQRIIGAWVEDRKQRGAGRPPQRRVGPVSKAVKEFVEKDKIDPWQVLAGVMEWDRTGFGLARLPDYVDQQQKNGHLPAPVSWREQQTTAMYQAAIDRMEAADAAKAAKGISS